MDIGNISFVLWIALVLYATGQIWFCQIVVDPLFAMVGEKDYVQSHHFYLSHIPMPVILPGFACFLLPLAMPFLGPAAIPPLLHGFNIALGFVGLMVTLFLEIPRHGRLERDGKDLRIIGELVRYNRPRTASISLQAVITAIMLTYVFSPA